MTQNSRKPADQLADIREAIKRLQIEEDQLRSEFVAGKHELTGDEYQVVIVKTDSSRVDVKMLRSTLAPDELRPFLKTVPRGGRAH
jgi:hypothetical protein